MVLKGHKKPERLWKLIVGHIATNLFWKLKQENDYYGVISSSFFCRPSCTKESFHRPHDK